MLNDDEYSTNIHYVHHLHVRKKIIIDYNLIDIE